MADIFNGSFAGEEQQALVECAATGMKMRAELADGEIGVAHIIFDVFEYSFYKYLVSRFDLQGRGGRLYLAPVGSFNGISMCQDVADP